jgi:hypothetical protein
MFWYAMVIGVSCIAVGLVGCAHQPDPQAPVVLSDPITMTCPPAETRKPPAEYMRPLGLEAPTILKKGEGDYGITRPDLEKLIDAHRSAAKRINQWKAWADPKETP